MDLRGEVRGRTVVVVEAIRAQGTKIEYVDRFLRLHGPRAIEYCALVVPAHANRSVPIHEIGFELDAGLAARGGAEPGSAPAGIGLSGAAAGTGYVIGYGLDYRERFRHLDCIAALAMQPGEPVFARGVA